MSETKITVIYDNPTDPVAFEAAYGAEQLEAARKIPGHTRCGGSGWVTTRVPPTSYCHCINPWIILMRLLVSSTTRTRLWEESGTTLPSNAPSAMESGRSGTMPVRSGFPFSLDIAAAGICAQAALYAVQLDVARSRLRLYAAARALPHLNVTAAGIHKYISGDIVGVNIAAACIGVQNAFN